MSEYTNLELLVIKHFSICFNYDNAESEIEDNATAFTVSEMAKSTGESIATIKGVLGSLTKKGLIEPWGRDLPNEFFIFPDGIKAHYSLK